jgi:hypothetical protein
MQIVPAICSYSEKEMHLVKNAVPYLLHDQYRHQGSRHRDILEIFDYPVLPVGGIIRIKCSSHSSYLGITIGNHRKQKNETS